MVKLAAEIVCLWKASSVFPSGKKYQGAGVWMGRKCLFWWGDVRGASCSWSCAGPKCGFTTRPSLLGAAAGAGIGVLHTSPVWDTLQGLESIIPCRGWVLGWKCGAVCSPVAVECAALIYLTVVVESFFFFPWEERCSEAGFTHGL